MAREVHKPAGHPSSHRGHQHSGLHKHGDERRDCPLLISQTESASTLGHYDKNKDVDKLQLLQWRPTKIVKDWSPCCGTEAEGAGLVHPKNRFSRGRGCQHWNRMLVEALQPLSLEDFKTDWLSI